MFPDNATAEKWFIENRWPDGVVCTKCGSMNVAKKKKKEGKPKAYRCRDCRNDFSVKTGTLMHNSPLGFQTWAVAIHLLITNLKGVSNMKLHRDLDITQKSAWHLAHRIRETWKNNKEKLTGTVEVDETFIGAKDKEQARKQKKSYSGTFGKSGCCGNEEKGDKQSHY